MPLFCELTKVRSPLPWMSPISRSLPFENIKEGTPAAKEKHTKYYKTQLEQRVFQIRITAEKSVWICNLDQWTFTESSMFFSPLTQINEGRVLASCN